MSENRNIINLPVTTDHRLELAIQAFDSGDNSKKLFDEFVDLINMGVKEANYYVGCMYEDGSNGVDKNLEFAFFYYKKAAEEFGYLEGYLATARLYYHGTGVQQDYSEAFKYYSHIAQKTGHPVACFMLGRLYQYGTGVVKDIVAARNWYLRAIEQGSIYGMINLAMLEAEEGHLFKSIILRVKAAFMAVLIATKNRHDSRLRGG